MLFCLPKVIQQLAGDILKDLKGTPDAQLIAARHFIGLTKRWAEVHGERDGEETLH